MIQAICLKCAGDIWAGFENGVIKVWPWESVEKSLALSPEERHMAALLVERSGIDLKSQVTTNGVCSIPSSDVKYLLSDNVTSKIWAASSLSFSLWYDIVFTISLEKMINLYIYIYGDDCT